MEFVAQEFEFALKLGDVVCPGDAAFFDLGFLTDEKAGEACGDLPAWQCQSHEKFGNEDDPDDRAKDFEERDTSPYQLDDRTSQITIEGTGTVSEYQKKCVFIPLQEMVFIALRKKG